LDSLHIPIYYKYQFGAKLQKLLDTRRIFLPLLQILTRKVIQDIDIFPKFAAESIQ